MNCRKCQKDKFIFEGGLKIEGGIKTKWVVATCSGCGESFNFGYKQKPYNSKDEPFAHYKRKGKKHLLKIDGIFKEVCIAIGKKGAWRVMPIDEFGGIPFDATVLTKEEFLDLVKEAA